ncbi:MAG: single-stranded DNA-binding protein [Bacteroidia bacterium]|jgi:single-strand DNA-binding protein|nr:single-stranded DNA-binding protein [Bacteroidia bacterium]
MANVNKVILIGNLGRDPEIRYMNNNVPKATFVLATHEYFKDSQGRKVEQTEWHNIVCWRALAEIAKKILKKGMKVYVEGRLQTRQWVDKNGNRRQITEIVADNFIVIRKLYNKQEEQELSSAAPTKEIIQDNSEPTPTDNLDAAL